MSKTPVKIPLLEDDLSKSIAGFLIAVIVGALAPRAITYLMKRVFTQALKEVFTIVAAGWLTDQLLKLISGSQRKTAS